MVSGFSVHGDHAEAERRGLDGFRFFGYALGHHYIFGTHKPGRTNIWKSFEGVSRSALPGPSESGGIGTPRRAAQTPPGSSPNAGVDQVAFIQQGGRNLHEHICESLEIFGQEVLPEFAEKEDERQQRKMEELAPYIEKAFERKKFMQALSDEQIPDVTALGRQIVDPSQQMSEEEQERVRRLSPRRGTFRSRIPQNNGARWRAGGSTRTRPSLGFASLRAPIGACGGRGELDCERRDGGQPGRPLCLARCSRSSAARSRDLEPE